MIGDARYSFFQLVSLRANRKLGEFINTQRDELRHPTLSNIFFLFNVVMIGVLKNTSEDSVKKPNFPASERKPEAAVYGNLSLLSRPLLLKSIIYRPSSHHSSTIDTAAK